MPREIHRISGFLAAVLLTVGPVSAAPSVAQLDLPWRAAGLDERQAAAHLLDRLAYGPRPGEIDRVAAMGVENWLAAQLAGVPDPHVEGLLDGLETLDFSAREMGMKFPRRGAILRLAVEAGILERPGGGRGRASPGEMAEEGRKRAEGRDQLGPEDRRKVMEWAREQGFRSQRTALGELMAQKLARARYSENQLREVLTDFWFNHFNVSITDPQARVYVWTYERDAVRPHVLGSFRDMLGATAKHPAMLHYLDNVRSVAGKGAPTTLDQHLRGRRGERFRARRARPGNRGEQATGLNENYARELMELHTLGVDGGYDQRDVVEVARAFTGWTAYPPAGNDKIKRRLERARRHPEAGFVIEEAFIFRADAHDAGEKKVLGHTLAAGRGLEDGLEVLDLLAAHPSTAHHLATKLAARFVADEPPPSLVDRLAAVYLASEGDLLRVVEALVESPEFWDPAARQAKIKSPFELTVSALRATGAEITDPRGLLEWLSRMGQPLYAYEAPTGYPDRAQAWVNTGALLSRMNFGLQLASGRVAGVELDLAALTQGREPESLGEALRTFVPILLPERDPAQTLARLGPIVHDPDLARKIRDSAPEADASPTAGPDDWDLAATGPFRRRSRRPSPPPQIDDSPLAQVVGVVIGSPDFQRR